MQKTKGRAYAVAALGFMLMFTVYAPNINLVGLFVTPMAESFGVSRTGATFIATLFTLTSTATYLVAGKILGRWPMNRIMAAALAALGLAHLGIASAGGLPLVYVLSGVRGVCNSLLTVVPISMAVNAWFDPARGGKPLGIAMAGSGLGAMLLNPVTGYIIESFGWRWGTRLYGLLALAMLVPVLLLFKLPTASEAGAGALDGTQAGADPQRAAETPGAKQGGAPKHRPPAKDAPPHNPGGMAPGARLIFFLLFFAYMLVASSTQSFNVNGPAFLGDVGFSTTATASLLSLMSFGLILGKVGLGLICDRWGAKTGNRLSMGAIALGYLLFLLSTRAGFAAVPAAFIIGFGMATNTIVQPLTAAGLFKGQNYGVLLSHLQLGTNFGSGLFPLIISAIYEGTGSYRPGWWLLVGLLAVALGLVSLAYRLQGQMHKA